jgi:hypothetical protein
MLEFIDESLNEDEESVKWLEEVNRILYFKELEDAGITIHKYDGEWC